MQDISPVLIAICGLLFVGFGLLAVIAFLVVKTTGKTLLEAFGDIGGVFAALGGGTDDEVDSSLPRRAPRRARDLRARARSLDFDSAVARQADRPSGQSAPPRPASGSLNEDDLPSLRSYRPSTGRRHRDSSDEDPDIFAAFMDEE
ncbi:MAG: hypothetical protein HXY41_06340 [Chloroflexi bacterium]|nr:hypothetical protein [Chloroflexota bacterium]